MKFFKLISTRYWIALLLFFNSFGSKTQTTNFRFESSKILTLNHVTSDAPNEALPKNDNFYLGFNSCMMLDFKTDKRFGWSTGISVKKQRTDLLGYEAYNVSIDPDGNINVDGVYKYYTKSFHFISFLFSGNYNIISKENFRLRFDLGIGIEYLYYIEGEGFNPKESSSLSKYFKFNLNTFSSLNLENKFINGWTLGFKVPYFTSAVTPNYSFRKTFDLESTLTQRFVSLGLGCYLSIPLKSKK